MTVPALMALPVVTAPTPSAKPVAPLVQALELSGIDASALASVEPAGASPPQAALRAAGPTTVVLTPQRRTEGFRSLGVTWAAGTGDDLQVTVRTRTEGSWTDWTALEDLDDGPDDPAAEAAAPGRRDGTAPLWVGESDGVQVRVQSPNGSTADELRVDLVEPGEAPADARLDEVSTPMRTATAATGQPQIIRRAAWGADESLRKAAPAYSPTIKAAIVHHTASTNNYSEAEAAAQVRSFYAYHTKSLGWSDIGYNFLVDRFGRIYEGRYGGVDRAVVGAHAGGFNTGTVGVAMIGTHTSVPPTAATLGAVRDVLAWKLAEYGLDPKGKTVLVSGGGSSARYPAGTAVPTDVIAGHRTTNATSCPGDAAVAKLPGLRAAVAQAVATSPTPTGAPARPAPIGAPASTTPIGAKHAALGGSSGFLGAATSSELPATGGRYRTYAGGAIYWSAPTGAREVHGTIRQKWAAQKWEQGPLGYPVTDEGKTHLGVGGYNHFQRGSIYWSQATGAWTVGGSIRETWGRLGWERGPLGYPVTDEGTTHAGVGRYNHFSGGGSIYWTPRTGARELRGSIRQLWGAMGWERGPLGYPLTNEGSTHAGVGRYNHFERGSIYWTPQLGAKEVRGGIRDRWGTLDWERGPLGYPTSDEYSIPGGRRSDFQGGSIVWDGRTGATTVNQGASR